MSTLTISGLRKSFGAVEVLRNIDIALGDGGFLVLLGPSGCGKSTLLSMIAGLEDVTIGEVRIGDRVVNDVKPKDRNIAMVFQSYALYPTMTVGRNLGFGLEMRGVAKAEREVETRRAAELLQIGHLLDRKPAQLSGGQRQRVAMGRAIVRDPELFLFDEPLSNLDAKLRVEMRAEIKRLHETLGTTIVYVTHDQVEAMTLGTQVAVMRDGVIQQMADPQTIYDQPANLFVAGFIGSPAMNMIRGTLRRVKGEIVLAYGADPDCTLKLNDVRGIGDIDATDVIVGIRPEDISVETEGACILSGTIERLEPTGPDTLVSVRSGEQRVLARMSPRVRLTPGQSIRLGIDTRNLCIFDPEGGARINPL